MDNITHSLVGMAVGEASLCNVKEKSKWRVLLWLTSSLANNIPDGDIFYMLFYSSKIQGRLGYLLHHRGFTHTLLMAIPQSLFIIGLLWISLKISKQKLPKLIWKQVVLVAFLGPFLHIGLDSLNTYGVHPFWPFNNDWFYGDSMFIVEPILWVSIIPFLLFSVSRKISFFIWFCLFAGIMMLPWWSLMTPPKASLMINFIGLLTFLLFLFVKSVRKKIVLAMTLPLLIITAFIISTQIAKQQIQADTNKQFIEIATTTFPGNFFCHMGITIEMKGSQYIVHKGATSIAPGLFSHRECAEYAKSTNVTAFMSAPDYSSNKKVVWLGKFEADINELKQLRKIDCDIADYLRFSRIPFWLWVGEKFVIGDVRFMRGRKMGFSGVEFHPNLRATCSMKNKFVPWTEPLLEILKP